MKRSPLVLCCTFVLALSMLAMCACSSSNSNSSSASNTAFSSTTQSSSELVKPTGSIQQVSAAEFKQSLGFKIDGAEYALPLEVKSLENASWSAGGIVYDANQVNPGQTNMGYFLYPKDWDKNKEHGLRVQVLNSSSTPLPWNECSIVNIEGNTANITGHSFETSAGVKLGDSFDKVLQVYGQPTSGDDFQTAAKNGQGTVELTWKFKGDSSASEASSIIMRFDASGTHAVKQMAIGYSK